MKAGRKVASASRHALSEPGSKNIEERLARIALGNQRLRQPSITEEPIVIRAFWREGGVLPVLEQPDSFA